MRPTRHLWKNYINNWCLSRKGAKWPSTGLSAVSQTPSIVTPTAYWVAERWPKRW